MPKYTYLLIFNDMVGSESQVQEFLDAQPEIVNWLRYLPHSFFIVSELTATQLGELFRRFTKGRGRYLILDTNTDRNGWLPKEVWELMQKPHAWNDPPPEKEPGT